MVFFDDVPFAFLVELPALLLDVFAMGTFPLELVLANAVDLLVWAFLELLLLAIDPADDCCMIDDGRCSIGAVADSIHITYLHIL